VILVAYWPQTARLNVIVCFLGAACRPAQWLRKTKKRFQACPLDWMMKYSLDTALHCFRTNFKDFFEDVEETNEYSGSCRVVRDKKNDIVSMHHFKSNLSLEDAKNNVRDMMSRRAQAVAKILKKSNSIVLLCNRQKNSHTELINFLKEFSKIYPDKNITLINIHSNNSDQITKNVIYNGKASIVKSKKGKPSNKYTKKPKKLCFIEYCFKDVSPNRNVYPEWEGNPNGWQTVINDIEVTNKFLNKNIDFKKVEF